MNSTIRNTEIGQVQNKIPNHGAYITAQKSNNLTTKAFKEKLKQADLRSKNSFDNILIY